MLIDVQLRTEMAFQIDNAGYISRPQPGGEGECPLLAHTPNSRGQSWQKLVAQDYQEWRQSQERPEWQKERQSSHPTWVKSTLNFSFRIVFFVLKDREEECLTWPKFPHAGWLYTKLCRENERK